LAPSPAPPANTDRLRGFLSLVMLYVKMLSANETQYLKYLIPLHGRTNFSAQFKQLPPAQRTALAANHAQALINCVVHAANSVALIPNVLGGFYDNNYAAGTALARNFRPGGLHLPAIFQSLTLGDWLRGLATGTDQLTPDKMRRWAEKNGSISAVSRPARVRPRSSPWLKAVVGSGSLSAIT